MSIAATTAAKTIESSLFRFINLSLLWCVNRGGLLREIRAERAGPEGLQARDDARSVQLCARRIGVCVIARKQRADLLFAHLFVLPGDNIYVPAARHPPHD